MKRALSNLKFISRTCVTHYLDNWSVFSLNKLMSKSSSAEQINFKQIRSYWNSWKTSKYVMVTFSLSLKYSVSYIFLLPKTFLGRIYTYRIDSIQLQASHRVCMSLSIQAQLFIKCRSWYFVPGDKEMMTKVTGG
jgi:hypothetical protein